MVDPLTGFMKTKCFEETLYSTCNIYAGLSAHPLLCMSILTVFFSTGQIFVTSSLRWGEGVGLDVHKKGLERLEGGRGN